MKNRPLLCITLSAMVIFLAMPALKIYSEVQDPSEGFLCDSRGICAAYDLLMPIYAVCNLSYYTLDDKTFIEDNISYLSKYEKSPPMILI